MGANNSRSQGHIHDSSADSPPLAPNGANGAIDGHGVSALVSTNLEDESGFVVPKRAIKRAQACTRQTCELHTLLDTIAKPCQIFINLAMFHYGVAAARAEGIPRTAHCWAGASRSVCLPLRWGSAAHSGNNQCTFLSPHVFALALAVQSVNEIFVLLCSPGKS